MRQREVRQGLLFEDENPVHAPQLPKDVEQEVTPVLVHWMIALAKTIGAGAGNE
jgi:hypothetical protein